MSGLKSSKHLHLKQVLDVNARSSTRNIIYIQRLFPNFRLTYYWVHFCSVYKSKKLVALTVLGLGQKHMLISGLQYRSHLHQGYSTPQS